MAPSAHWLLLEFELWLHGARDADFGGELAERYDGAAVHWPLRSRPGRRTKASAASGIPSAGRRRRRAAARRRHATPPRPHRVALSHDVACRRAASSDFASHHHQEHGHDLTLDDIDLLEDTWAAACPTSSSQAAAPRGAGVLARDPERTGLLGGDQARRHQGDQPGLGDATRPSWARRSSKDFTEEALELVRMTLLNMDPPRQTRYRRLGQRRLHSADDQGPDGRDPGRRTRDRRRASRRRTARWSSSSRSPSSCRCRSSAT